MKKIIGIGTLVLVVIIGGYVVIHSRLASQHNTPLVVGVILPLTGDSAVTGEKLHQGVELAEGELAQKNIQFVVEDSHSDSRDAVSAASKLLNVDHVDVIVGTYSPDETIAVAPLADAKGEDVFSFSFCSDSFKSLANVFCGYPNAQKQLDTVLPLLQKKGVERLAIVDSASDFGIQSRNVMTQDASSTGYTVVYSDLIPTSKDYRTLATKALASGADALFTATDDPIDALTLVKQARELGFKGTAITFIDVDSKNLAGFGSAAENTYAPGIAPSQFSPAFTSAYQSAFGGKEPDYVSALGYDMTRYVVGAMEARGGKDLTQAALGYSYESPAIHGFHFLDDRTVIYDLELQVVKDQEYVQAKY